MADGLADALMTDAFVKLRLSRVATISSSSSTLAAGTLVGFSIEPGISGDEM
jgi:hypothetical protein